MKNFPNSTHDPVCGKKINANKAYAKVNYERKLYYLCCPLCQSEFLKDPLKYVDNKNSKGG